MDNSFPKESGYPYFLHEIAFLYSCIPLWDFYDKFPDGNLTSKEPVDPFCFVIMLSYKSSTRRMKGISYRKPNIL